VKRCAVVLLVLAATTGAAQQAVPAGGTLVEHRVASAALANNLLSDPAEARVAVYLPPSYAASPTRRYPAFYLLHGYLADIEMFTRGFRSKSLPRTMDELIARGVMREMIVVVPSARTGYFGSFYTNSPVYGRWEDFISQELVAWVDANYRTLASSDGRGIAGHSMGGYGAIMLAMRHPDVFGALYAMSPCCVTFDADFGRDNQAWRKSLQYKTRDQLNPKPASFADFYATAFVAAAAAFSPNPSQGPLYVDLPFREQSGALVTNEDIYEKWRSKMPLYLVEQHRRNLQQLRGIYLDYGALEEFAHIRLGTRALSEELTVRGIAHTFEVYADGDHMNKVHERIETRVVRFFSDVLKSQ
jgi:S-formylglutathione hydrolase FrmB